MEIFMQKSSIEILDAGIRIHDLLIPKKDVADFFRPLEEEERELTLIQALEVGVFCLERVRLSQDTEFVRRQVESLISQVEKAVKSIPEATKEKLLTEIGTGEGQVLAPIHELVQRTSQTTAERIKEVKDLLSQEIDPSKETSILGKALKNLKDLLDPVRKDSIQGSLESAINGITAEEGSLAKAVKNVVAEAVKPLADEMDRLAKEIRGQEAALEALQETIEKGITYEHEVLERLQGWSKFAGAEVHHVGGDNRPGDIVIKFPAMSLHSNDSQFVLEVRDRKAPKGRKAISDDLSQAMAERESSAAIYLSRYPEGLAKEIGDWAEGTCEYGPWVATTDEHLFTSLRFLVAQKRLEEIKSSRPEIDASAVEDQIKRIKVSLSRIKTINQKIASLQNTTHDIKEELDLLRDEIRSAIVGIEDALRLIGELEL
jgi:predicted  nucleic acid-binding Zn-ribbon protein